MKVSSCFFIKINQSSGYSSFLLFDRLPTVHAIGLIAFMVYSHREGSSTLTILFSGPQSNVISTDLDGPFQQPYT